MAHPGIRLPNGTLCVFDPGESTISFGDYVVYESDDGTGCEPVHFVPSAVVLQRQNVATVQFVRVATETDHQQLLNREREEARAYILCREKIAAHRLSMKLVEAVYTYDFSRLTFYFSANGRVDFRELLKDLTATFRRTRILLRQIGIRDEAKLLSGVGSCGKALCCSTWLPSFMPVSMLHAKNQGLPANPSKLSGACGRLKCCLTYEDEQYTAIRAEMPPLGLELITPDGSGSVVGYQIIREAVQVELDDDGTLVSVALRDLPPYDPIGPETGDWPMER
jgi:cell fate regulator YaaT (PSP1 superfamily)